MQLINQPAASDRPARIVLTGSLLIDTLPALKEALVLAAASGLPMEIELSAVTEMDLATVQLLYAARCSMPLLLITGGNPAAVQPLSQSALFRFDPEGRVLP